MRNNDYHLKIHRGSTPRHEMRQGPDGQPGGQIAAVPEEVLGGSVPSFLERLHRPNRLPDVR
jgi:hypothetical protein